MKPILVFRFGQFLNNYRKRAAERIGKRLAGPTGEEKIRDESSNWEVLR